MGNFPILFHARNQVWFKRYVDNGQAEFLYISVINLADDEYHATSVARPTKVVAKMWRIANFHTKHLFARRPYQPTSAIR